MNISGLLHLFVVYIVWGSTYLGIRVAVQEGSGFPPMMMSTLRVFAGSIILLGLVKLVKRKSVTVPKAELKVLAISGLALWFGGNGLVAVAETTVDSGYAALLIACTPIWVAIIEAVLDRQRPTLHLVLSLLTGMAGIAVLNWPSISTGNLGDLGGAGLLTLAGLSWGAGSVYQKRKHIHSSPEVSSAYQQIFGGGGLLVASILMKESIIKPTPEAWMAWGYLVVFGSVIAFTSFVKALKLLPTKIVLTYAYVNPVIAVILGFIILGEPITQWTFAGAILVIIGVLGVFKEQQFSTPQSG